MEYGKDYFGFVYIWYNRASVQLEKIDYKNRHGNRGPKKKHPRLYIGCHYGPYDDGYICSSRWMLASYKRKPQNFIRRILYWQKTPNREALLIAEREWLSKIKKEELGTRFYNFIRRAGSLNGGTKKGAKKGFRRFLKCDHPHEGHNIIGNGSCRICHNKRKREYQRTPERRKKRNARNRKPEYRAKRRQQYRIVNGPPKTQTGIPKPREQVEKMLAVRWTQEKRKAYGDAQRGVSKSPEYRRKISDTLKNKGIVPPVWQQQKCEHCGKICNLGSHARWHGENCRNKREIE